MNKAQHALNVNTTTPNAGMCCPNCCAELPKRLILYSHTKEVPRVQPGRNHKSCTLILIACELLLLLNTLRGAVRTTKKDGESCSSHDEYFSNHSPGARLDSGLAMLQRDAARPIAAARHSFPIMTMQRTGGQVGSDGRKNLVAS